MLITEDDKHRMLNALMTDKNSSPTDIKIKSLLDELIFLKDADARKQIIDAVMNALSEKKIVENFNDDGTPKAS